jgi:hypothetical protein
MTLEITTRRLHNQRLSQTNFKTPNEVVQWLGAVQAQDYAAAKWAIAQRMLDTTDSALDQALAGGSILRTHLLRPTWHFVTPQDIRWLLKLTAPRVTKILASMDRQLEIDEALIKQSRAILVKALKGGKQLTRTELESALQARGIKTTDLRMIHFMMHAELGGIICSGGRRGKQFTYALLDERVPQTKSLTREEALAELAARYFSSRGPATLQDFIWWSGLTVTDARSGLELAKSTLDHKTVNDQIYWFPDLPSHKTNKSRNVYLLPNYDEYLVGYTDRANVFDAAHINKLDSRGGILFQHTVVINSRVAGTWKRTLKKNEVIIETTPFKAWTKTEKQGVAETAARFGKFLELPVSLNDRGADE